MSLHSGSKNINKSLLFFQSPKLEDLLHMSKLGKNEAWSGVGYIHIQLLQKCVICENNLKII